MHGGSWYYVFDFLEEIVYIQGSTKARDLFIKDCNDNEAKWAYYEWYLGNFKSRIEINPKYDLYISTVDPSIRATISDNQKNWNYLMDCLIRYFDGKTTILDIAIRHNLNYFEVYDYVKKFEAKGLVSFINK